jgi:predicted nucleic acid-binding protein
LGRQVVIDANVVVRLLLRESPEAEKVVREDELAAPGVLVPETLNALVTAARFTNLDHADAAELVTKYLSLDIELVPDWELAPQTFAVAAATGLSAYEAAYVALAIARDVPLVTGDKPVARAYPRSELIP